jgi:putative nucleotidyltransferase with HDIG domain
MVLRLSLGGASKLLLSRLARVLVGGFLKAEGHGLRAFRLEKRRRLLESMAKPLAAASGAARPAARWTASHQQPGYTDVVLDRLAFHAREVLGAERVSLLALNTPEERRTDAVVVTQVGQSANQVDRSVTLDGRLAALALGAGRPAVAPSRRGPPAPPSGSDGHGWDAAAPLSARTGPPRALVAGWAESDPAPGLTELELLCEFSALASRALRDQHDADAAAGRSQPDIEPLLAALAARDGSTLRHSVEVSELAMLVAKRLELGRIDQHEVRLAALLHDVGKLRLPGEMLRRPGPLSPAEWELMRCHPEWGAETVGAIPGLEAVAMIVRLHHERPDGAGYPHRLASERIPTASRIVSVCDAYCVMTSGRPNQPSRSPADAMRELERHAGTQFDDQIVATLWDAVTSRRAPSHKMLWAELSSRIAERRVTDQGRSARDRPHVSTAH